MKRLAISRTVWSVHMKCQTLSCRTSWDTSPNIKRLTTVVKNKEQDRPSKEMTASADGTLYQGVLESKQFFTGKYHDFLAFARYITMYGFDVFPRACCCCVHFEGAVLHHKSANTGEEAQIRVEMRISESGTNRSLTQIWSVFERFGHCRRHCGRQHVFWLSTAVERGHNNLLWAYCVERKTTPDINTLSILHFQTTAKQDQVTCVNTRRVNTPSLPVLCHSRLVFVFALWMTWLGTTRRNEHINKPVTISQSSLDVTSSGLRTKSTRVHYCLHYGLCLIRPQTYEPPKTCPTRIRRPSKPHRNQLKETYASFPKMDEHLKNRRACTERLSFVDRCCFGKLSDKNSWWLSSNERPRV